MQSDLSAPSHRNIFAIGDMAHFVDHGVVVPGVAPAATQQAECAVKNILRDLKGEPRVTFRYVDKGSMATIGRKKAIVQVGRWRLSGFIAWLIWLVVHVALLIDPRHRVSVLREWLWAYVTHERSSLLITGDAERAR